MNARRRKAEVTALLARRDLEAVVRWAGETRGALRLLFSLGYDDDALIQWRATEASGPTAAEVAGEDLDRVRRFVRGLFWLMNDESGGLGWHAAEVVGEVLRSVPALVPEFVHLLFHLCREEPFERGSYYALARLAADHPARVEEGAPTLLAGLDSPDPAIRGRALDALRALGTPRDTARIQELASDRSEYPTYDFRSGELARATVGEAAARCLAALERPPSPAD